MHPIDDDSAVALLRPLDGEPLTASTIDIDRAVREGRRRRRRRTATRSVALAAAAGLAIAGGGAAVATLRGSDAGPDPDVAASASAGPSGSTEPSARPARTAPITSAPPAPPRSCTVSLLPVPDGVKMAIVTGADPTGRIILGRSYLGDGDKQALIWRDGTAQKIPLVGSEPILSDVNTAGTVVGFEYGPGEAGSSPVVYRDGAVTKLPALDAAGGDARGINEAGTIVGNSGQGRTTTPVRWASADSRPEALPMPRDHASATARDIDEDGTIVGYAGDQQAPYVWFPDGEHRALTVPTLDGAKASSSDAMSIRNGWVVGMAQFEREDRAVRWNVYTGEATVYPDISIRPSAVNAHGWVIGPARNPSGLYSTPAGTITLNGLPQHKDALALAVIPTTISDDGRTIAGQSDDNTQTIRAVIWRCS